MHAPGSSVRAAAILCRSKCVRPANAPAPQPCRRICPLRVRAGSPLRRARGGNSRCRGVSGPRLPEGECALQPTGKEIFGNPGVSEFQYSHRDASYPEMPRTEYIARRTDHHGGFAFFDTFGQRGYGAENTRGCLLSNDSSFPFFSRIILFSIGFRFISDLRAGRRFAPQCRLPARFPSERPCANPMRPRYDCPGTC